MQSLISGKTLILYAQCRSYNLVQHIIGSIISVIIVGATFNYVHVGAVVTIPSISETKVLLQCSTVVQYNTVHYITYKYVIMHII